MTDPTTTAPQEAEPVILMTGIKPAVPADDSHVDATPVIPAGLGEMLTAIQADIAQLGELAEEWKASTDVPGRALVRVYRHTAHDMAVALAQLRLDHLTRLRERMGNLGKYARVRDLPQETPENV